VAESTVPLVEHNGHGAPAAAAPVGSRNFEEFIY